MKLVIESCWFNSIGADLPQGWNTENMQTKVKVINDLAEITTTEVTH